MEFPPIQDRPAVEQIHVLEERVRVLYNELLRLQKVRVKQHEDALWQYEYNRILKTLHERESKNKKALSCAMAQYNKYGEAYLKIINRQGEEIKNLREGREKLMARVDQLNTEISMLQKLVQLHLPPAKPGDLGRDLVVSSSGSSSTSSSKSSSSSTSSFEVPDQSRYDPQPIALTDTTSIFSTRPHSRVSEMTHMRWVELIRTELQLSDDSSVTTLGGEETDHSGRMRPVSPPISIVDLVSPTNSPKAGVTPHQRLDEPDQTTAPTTSVVTASFKLNGENQSFSIPLKKTKAKIQYICTICGHSYAWEKSLRRHIDEAHTKSITYACKYCDRTFPRKGTMQRHEEAHGRAATRHHCKFCQRVFLYRKALYTHCRKEHDEESDPDLEDLDN